MNFKEQQHPPATKTERISVIAFACFVALLVLMSAYCTDRGGSVDEPGFLNPPYMLVHFGRLTFPTYPHNGFFDVPVITHPPVHLLWIGLLWRLGLSVYYAEATPTVLLLLFSIAIIWRSMFPTPVKLGWLFSIGFLAASGEALTVCFGSRPEGEIQAAWFCGLLLLEAGRIQNWDRRWLGAGAFFLIWASGTHYYAGPAAAGVLVYAVWAIWALGWKGARPRLLAMGLGICLFALPYFALYVIPYFREISSTIRGTIGQGGIGLSVQRHLSLYAEWSKQAYHPALIRDAMTLGVPLLVFSTAILVAIRSTRGIALAALPLLLGIFLLVWRKMPPYVLHESIIFAAAVAIGLLVLSHYLISRLSPKLERGFAPMAVILLSICLVKSGPMWAQARVSLKPRVHEMEVAHAAGQRMLGTNARVGGRWWSWYASGAERWYDVERDLHLGAIEFDPLTYLQNVDAINVCSSPDDPGRSNSWYADGTLKIRGFYFAQSNSTLRCVLLKSERVTPLTGYAAWNGQLYHFEENSEGNYDVLSVVCKPGGPDWHDPPAGVFSATLRLNSGPEAGDRIVTLLAPRSSLTPVGEIGQSCREISRVPGTLLPEDATALLNSSRQNNPTMHFYRNIEELPGYAGIGLSPNAIPPPDGVPVEGVILDLSAIEASHGARLEHVPQARVTTVSGIGAFSAGMPVKHAENVTGPCWLVLKLRVLSGRIGFGAFDRNVGLLGKSLAIAPSPEPQSVAVLVPDFRHATDIVVFNEGATTVAKVDVFDARLLMRPNTP